MGNSNIFDLCWDSSENLFLLLSDKLLILRTNDATEEVFNCTKNKLLQKKITSLFKEKLKQDFPENIVSSERTQITTRLLNDYRKFKIKWEIIRLAQNVADKEPAFLLIGRTNDILIKKNEEMIQFDHLIKYSPGLFYWKDTDAIYRGCNDEFATLAGLSSRFDVDGKTDHDLPWGDRAIEYIAVDKEVMRTGRPALNHEEVVKVSNGEDLTMVTNKVPLFDKNDQVVGLLGITIDITNQKRAEKELELANNSKTEFIANMSHDVKTPLAGIISLSEILDSCIQEDYRHLAKDIFKAGKQLMIFFENCIELSKLEIDSSTLPKDNFDLKKILDEIFDLFQPTIKAKNLNMHLQYEEKMPKRFFGSGATFYRILLNLVGNAVKFTPEGSITISAKLTKKANTDQTVVQIMVTDTGIGIPKDKKAFIFERFSRLSPSYEGTYKGHGIGLYLVQKFVEKMNGQLSVKSKEGKGSQFIVAVPLQVALSTNEEYENEIDFSPMNSIYSNIHTAMHEADDSPKLLERKPINMNCPKILLVEDSEIAQKGVIILLESLGYQVVLAKYGQAAINLFKPGYYVLAFIDIGLPDMKGYEVATQLRAMEKGTAFCVPILGLSAHVTKEEAQLSYAAGMNEVLNKPLLKEPAKQILKQYVTDYVVT